MNTKESDAIVSDILRQKLRHECMITQFLCKILKESYIMKKHSYLMIVLLAFMACKERKNDSYTILKGNLSTNTDQVQTNYNGNRNTVSIAEDGSFIDTLAIKVPQYVYLSFGNLSTKIYIAPGDEVRISVDSRLNFSDDKKDINNYLYRYIQNNFEQQEAEYSRHKEIFSLNEVDHIQYRDSIKKEKLKRLQQLPKGTETFQKFHQKDIEFQYQYDVARYPNYHSFYSQEHQPTELISSFLEGVDVDNEEYARNYSEYGYLVDLVLDKQIENLNDKSLSTLEANLFVIKDIKSPTILHRRLSKALIYFSANEKNMELSRDKMLALARLDKTKRQISEHYDNISKLKPGSLAPAFNFENYKGGNTKLDDFKGKYVYIDVWATWCGPCIKEIPHLKKIEEEFSDASIEFVSISIDESRFYNGWRNMVKSKELTGTQLIADNGWNSSFVIDYGIKGLPRFMLLDDKGYIISADVEKPSDPKLRERLYALGI